MSKNPTIIVGGGWAGLSCAVHLAKHQHPTLCLEAGPHLGGRARTIRFGPFDVDNGQHLLIGAYQETKELLELVHNDTSPLIQAHPFEWAMQSPNSHCHLKFANAPSPWHILIGFLKAKGLNLKDKWRMAQWMRQLDQIGLYPDQPVLKTLLDAKQTKRAIDFVWSPMCLAAMTTPIETASSHLFAQVLHQALMQTPKDANWWFSAVDLGKLLPEPSALYIKAHQGEVLLNHRAIELILDHQKIIGVKTKQGSFYGSVVLATPFKVTQQLLAPIPTAKPIIHQLSNLNHEPITTVYLHYPGKQLPKPMTGLSQSVSQWVFDRSFANQKGLLAVVMSGHGEHLTLPKEQLIAKVESELNTHWPYLGHAKAVKVIHEKTGAMSAQTYCQNFRPAQLSSIPNLYLAGDYTALPYPSTLEGAVLSGKICAREILRTSNEQTNQQSFTAHPHAAQR